MRDLETRLRGDLAELAETISVDEPAGWAAVRERGAADRPGTASLVPAPRRLRRGSFAAWAAAAAVVLVGVAGIVVLAGRDSGGNPGPGPASIGTTSLPTTTLPARVDGVGLDGRMAVLPTTPSDVNAGVVPAAFTWASGARTARLLARDDGSAWARVDLDRGASTWDEAAAKVGSGVEPTQLGEAPALQFQEFTTWVIMWRQGDATATLRTGGLDMAAVHRLGTALAVGDVPEGWRVADGELAWNTFTATDQFGIAVGVRSTELPDGTDPLLGAVDAASAGATVQSVEVEGASGWFVDPVGTSRSDLPELVWERDGMLIALSRQDATVGELQELASSVTIEPLDGLTVPVGGLQGNAAATTVLPRDVAILDRLETPDGGRYQWVAFRVRLQTDGRTEADGWCVQYMDSAFADSWLGGMCGPMQGTFAGVAQIVAGTATGVVADDVSSAWFVVNGVRADAHVTALGDLKVIRATVPLGDRVSLRLVRGGDEVAGNVGLDVTTMCVGCPPPVIAPPGWIMPTLTPGGVVVPSTAIPGP